MFAGIVEGTCRVAARTPVRAADLADAHSLCRIDVELAEFAEGLAPGASVAINGVCLTLCGRCGTIGSFDVIPETLQKTNLSTLRVGQRVNVERSLRLGDRIDGHLVQGHVDGVATVVRADDRGDDRRLWFSPPAELLKFLVSKGSIALDGVSLTLASVSPAGCSVALIPSTLAQTVLGERKAGDLLNVETDVFARLVVQRTEQMLAAGSPRRIPHSERSCEPAS